MAKAEEYLNGWKRAKADLINYKKDELKRFEEFGKFANEALIREMVVVLDNFSLAVGASAKDKGVQMIKSQLENVLKNQGLEKLVVSVGQEFDPALHEAVEMVESNKQSGTIVEEIEAGYTLNGKLIKPAKVKVTK